ncbi:MAG TPA: hypothetical protein DCQ92_12635 [Verrucomicrobia subdivision 3 bacterium]|nr:hypothetical protein [Limisphaerales bacterium]
MKTKTAPARANYFLLSLLEQNGDYEYEHVGLIKVSKSVETVAERIARRWYDEESQKIGCGFLFHEGCVSVSVDEVKRVQQNDAKVLLRHLPLWE